MLGLHIVTATALTGFICNNPASLIGLFYLFSSYLDGCWVFWKKLLNNTKYGLGNCFNFGEIGFKWPLISLVGLKGF